MPHFDIDDMKSLKEPIQFTLDGKTYTVKELTRDVMKAASEAVDNNKGDTVAILAEQLSVFTGEPIETFIDLSLLRLQAAIAYINKSFDRTAEEARKKAERSR